MLPHSPQPLDSQIKQHNPGILGLREGPKLRKRGLMFVQTEGNLTARRFKVTASSKMHLDLSTASIGAALLGTA